MMTVPEQEIDKLNEAYEQMFDVFERNELTPEMTFGLMVKLVVQIAGDIPKPELLSIISSAHDIDRFMRPRSEEMH
jgi:P2-related tail formation protein